MEEDEPRDYVLTTPETSAFVRAHPGFWDDPKAVAMMKELIRRVYYDEKTETNHDD